MRGYIKTFILIAVLLISRHTAYTQDTSGIHLTIDTAFTWVFPTYSIVASPYAAISDYSISHNPSKEDTIIFKKYKKLINAQPNKKNHSDYYSLACSLWELNRVDESEKMFLKMIASKEPYYEDTYYHSSDIPGDTTTNTYGYGSFTSNYKNSASRYLTRIYLEQKKFDQALLYLDLSEKKYKVSYNCGTGYRWHWEEISGLYGLCYEGLQKYDSIINMFLNDYQDWDNRILIRSLKKVYSQAEINKYLIDAENSVIFTLDSFPSSSFIINNYGEVNETTTEIKYLSGTASMMLFNKQVMLPRPNLKDGEKVSRELFIKNFKESGLYSELSENY
jgi:hypothetical protein